MKFADLTNEELEEVRQKIGRIVLNLPFVSGQLGHTTMAATIRGNYLTYSGVETKSERLAKEFVNDIFKLKTSEMCEKWYGDPTGAAVRRTMRVLA